MKNSLRLKMLIFTGLCLFFYSCKKNVDVKVKAPEVKFNIPTMGYTTYVDQEIKITPIVNSIEKTTHLWKEGNKEISKEATLSYTSDKADIHIITYSASNEGGKIESTINIEVIAVDAPKIDIDIPTKGFYVKEKKELIIEAQVKASKECKYSWKEGDKELSINKILKFSSKELGTHTLVFSADNMGVKTEKTITIKVVSTFKAEISFIDNKTTFYLKKGESIEFNPIVNSKEEVKYEWILKGKILSENKNLTYTSSSNGLNKFIFKASNAHGETSCEIKLLTGCREENSESSNTVTKVFCFTPAAGQFINEGYDCNTMEEANEYAIKSLLNKGFYLSLGGFGGYVIMGFDHSILDNEKEDILIKGNSFDGSSEPGIVWVMQDENNNEKPDDTWYQLKGSEYDKPETIQNYSVTYTKPSTIKQEVTWSDNQGNKGSIDYLSKYHNQDYYYPNWIKENSYTLSGPRLKGKVTEEGGIYRNNLFDWGYVDNKDHVTDGNLFELKNAVDVNGNAIELGFIDFIKVQNSMNEKAGWIGENSTEILHVEDLK